MSATIPELKALRALHGKGGKWDAKRKAMLEATKIRARMEAMKAGEKVTESYIDTLGHADSQYSDFIEQGIAGGIRLVELETLHAEIQERIESRKAELYYEAQTAWLER